MPDVTVIGAGLAGCEAAWQLAKRGVSVRLCEMKPARMSPAHHSEDFAELVCSNSFRADRVQNAVGLLKEEMRRLDSLILHAADAHRVPAGGALAVDRDGFSRAVTDAIRSHPLIECISGEIADIPTTPCIVATGPLTSDALSASIQERMGDGLFFFDAAAPIVTKESLDIDKVFAASRYGKGEGDDYLNCPMTRDEYFAFYRALIDAETVELHEFESKRVFEGCMPVEVMAARGELTLAYGPLKPVGLTDPRTGQRPFAVVQLRQDNADATLYNIVGFQTHLKFPEQKRVFGLIPGLEHAEYARYGVMHRNTFIRSPGKLNAHFQCIDCPDLFFAGQITGVEGYVESSASGLVAGIAMACHLQGTKAPDFTALTAIGSLGHYVAHYNGPNFQPMNVSFGLMDPIGGRFKSKQERYTAIADRALEHIDRLLASGGKLS